VPELLLVAMAGEYTGNHAVRRVVLRHTGHGPEVRDQAQARAARHEVFLQFAGATSVE
jgi:hypothetical protein